MYNGFRCNLSLIVRENGAKKGRSARLAAQIGVTTKPKGANRRQTKLPP
jgi:hypothetical protein